ncbi:MAG TPA: alpha/beta fold hydrolase [Casimicrobiaceae bacterium]|nr:alpha/beta fold hydrolase [Casimicrobiaceae bacterium]
MKPDRSRSDQATLTDRAGDQPRVREGRVPVPGAELYFREIGSGPALVVLHGGPDFNHNYLLPDLDRLSSAFRLIYYDQRGRGKSSRGVVPEAVSLDSDVEDLDRLRRYFGLGSIAVMGHSWGALLAMEYAASHSDRVSHLILLNTAPASRADLLCLRQRRQAEEPATLAKMRDIAKTPGYASGDIRTEAEYYRLHYGSTLRRTDRVEDLVRRLRSHFTPEDILKARAIEDRLCEQTWMSPDYDVLARLRKLKAPTLVVHGDRDLVPLECALHVAEAVPGSRLAVLLDCGHFCYLERPCEVLQAIVGFFASCSTVVALPPSSP